MKAKSLYLKPWDYNKCILMDKIEQRVIKKGGVLKGYYTPGVIYGHDYSKGVATNHCDVFGSSTSFILDGYYYYIEFDDNPFFEFHYSKIPVTEPDANCASGKYYSDEMSKSWWSETLWNYGLSSYDYDTIVDKIMDVIADMAVSKVYDRTSKTVITPRTALNY